MGILVCKMPCQCFLVYEIFFAFQTAKLSHTCYQTRMICLSLPVAEIFTTLPAKQMASCPLMGTKLGKKVKDILAMATTMMMLSFLMQDKVTLTGKE